MDSSFNMRLLYVNMASEAIYNGFGVNGSLSEGVLTLIVNSFGAIGNKSQSEIIDYNKAKGFKVTKKDFELVVEFKKSLQNEGQILKSLKYFKENLIYLKTSSFEVNRFVKSCYRFL